MVYYGSSDVSACIVGRSTVVTAYDVDGDPMEGVQILLSKVDGGEAHTVSTTSPNGSIPLALLRSMTEGSFMLIVTDPSTGEEYRSIVVCYVTDEDDSRIIDYLSLMADPDDPQSALATD